MKIINKTKKNSYEQWVECFVRDALKSGNVDGDEVVIEDIDSERIWLTVDGKEYHIRTWAFEPVHHDSEGRPDSEDVRYSLFEMKEDFADELIYGTLRIFWEN